MSEQCPRCRRHKHEEFKTSKKGKKWVIDRCAEPTCRYNFDIKEDRELAKYKDLDIETYPNPEDKKPRGVNRKPDGGWLL